MIEVFLKIGISLSLRFIFSLESIIALIFIFLFFKS